MDSLTGTKVTVVAALLALILVVVLGIRYWNQDVEDSWAVSENADFRTPSSLMPLLSSPVSQILGDFVFLNSVELRRGPKPGVFLVQGAQGRHMLVLFDNGKSNLESARVDIEGRIRRVPPAQILRKDWDLSRSQAEFFEKQGLYFDAEYIKEQQKTKY